MSRRGNCWDNSPMERFFSSLKTEWGANRWLHRQRRSPAANQLLYSELLQ
ncbi:putative integrase [Escherichia coli 2731150]|nr:putative integrase [Escherichia coli 2762100]EMW89511.1 putative integrase [Escherichia coli 2731150]